MASWKKVIVSGSIAELNVVSASAYYIQTGQILTSPTNTIITGAFSGSFNGDGTNLSNVIAKSLSSVAISNIQNPITDTLFVSRSSTGDIARISVKDFLTDITNANDSNLEIDSSNDGIRLKQQISIEGATGSFTGSFYGNIAANQVANPLTAGNGISTFSFNGSTSNITVAIKTASAFLDNTILKWDADSNAFESSSLTDNGTAITGNTSIRLSGVNSSLTGSFSGSFFGTGVGSSFSASSNVDNRLVTATGTSPELYGEPNLTFDATTNVLNVQGGITANGYITLGGALSANGTINLNNATIDSNKATINLLQNATPTTINFGNASSTINIGNNLVINGDLTANGTSSFINSTNLLVADRFAVFASGALSPTDGGIIVQSSALPAGTGSGYAFYIETASPTTPRWAITASLKGNETSATPSEYMVSATSSTGAPVSAPTWGGTNSGYGNMYIQSTGEIWIYS